jgi:hypothetical protein
MLSLNRPSRKDHKGLFGTFTHPPGGHAVLEGDDYLMWNPDVGTDAEYFLIEQFEIQDIFSQWFQGDFFHSLNDRLPRRWRVGTDVGDDLLVLKSKRILRIGRLCSSAVASLIPILATIILYVVPSIKVRLGLLAVFSLILSVSLALFSKSSQGEIFLANTGFVTVMRIF